MISTTQLKIFKLFFWHPYSEKAFTIRSYIQRVWQQVYSKSSILGFTSGYADTAKLLSWPACFSTVWIIQPYVSARKLSLCLGTTSTKTHHLTLCSSEGLEQVVTVHCPGVLLPHGLWAQDQPGEREEERAAVSVLGPPPPYQPWCTVGQSLNPCGPHFPYL